MGFKIGGLSLPKINNLNDVADLAIKANMPLNNLMIGAKLAENLLYGMMRKNSIQRDFAANFPAAKTAPPPPEFEKPKV